MKKTKALICLIIPNTQKSFLNDKTDVAVARAKKLGEFQNPSTGIYKLIDLLQKNAKIVNH